MNVGIIAEYNPFHSGHKLHITNTRALTGADNIIAIMSGSFVQRGEPAILDKFSRTCMALTNGVDMVLELPVRYAAGSADVFAMGAVESLDKSGIVDMLSFGTEAGDIELFKEAAELLADESEEFSQAVKEEMSKGISYAAARQAALTRVLSRDMSFLSLPNNILALEYLKALKKLKSSIIPVTVRREVSDYNSTQLTGRISSAAAIRHSIFSGEWDTALAAVPADCRSMLKEVVFGKKPHIDSYSEVLKYILRTKSADEIAQIDDISEGLENRILSASDLHTVSEIADAVKSKRYAHSRVRRALLHIILGITKADAAKNVDYIRVLGFRREKAHLVSELTQKAAVPVITNIKNAPADLIRQELFATDIYYMPLSGETNKDYTMPMVIV